MEDHQVNDLQMRVSAMDFALRTPATDRETVQKTAQQYYLFLKRSTRIKKPKATP